MKAFEKHMALLIVLAMSLTCLFSCQKPAETDAIDWLQMADETLKSTTDYTAKIETSFSTSDDDMRAAVAALEKSETAFAVHGEDFSIDMQVELGETVMERSYVMVGEILYHASTLQVGEDTVTVKQKAEASALNLYLTLEDVSVGAAIGYEDFATLTLMNNDGTQQRVLCTDIRSDALIALTQILNSNFEDAKLLIDDVRYEAIIENGKFIQTALTVNCTVLGASSGYEFTAMRTTNYSYTSSVEVVAPSDSADYTTVSYGDIVQ